MHNKEISNTVAVVGGGPAGMAAAYSARVSGADHVILIERYSYLGGVLPQCIHGGFGTQLYNKDCTGGEYADIWKRMVWSDDIDIKLDTTVLSVTKVSVPSALLTQPSNEKYWKIECSSADKGVFDVNAAAVIVATGSRERTLPQLGVTGSRPSGIFTAGAAQLMMNLRNYLPGKTAVILGSGDIGLIMARRMTLEGIRVKLILGEKSTGLPRNIVQCVKDFDIPMKYGWTVANTHGYQRLKGVSIAPLSNDGKADADKKIYVTCDTLLVAAGLIPETEICGGLIPGKEEGLFVCGNADFIHDLVDNVTVDAVNTGISAVKYIYENSCSKNERQIVIDDELNKLKSKTSSRKYTEKQGNMVCTICPKGCMLQVDIAPFSVIGNECEKGTVFARQEIKSPKRTVTTVVKIEDALHPLLSVRTDRLVDKKDMSLIINAAKKIQLKPPVKIGDVVSENVAGLGVDLVATNGAE